MIPWELIGKAQVPGDGGEMRLYRRGAEFSIRVDRGELMNSRVHGSEEALAELACAKLGKRNRVRILIGGLGMGYTVAAALRKIGARGQIVVAELMPAVVEWNRGPLADLAGRPLANPQVTVRALDVGALLREGRGAYDGILLDVDNGPAGFTRKENRWLYAEDGLAAAFAALRPGGVLGVWSVGPERGFTRRLRRAGFDVNEVSVRARGSQGGGWHVVWIGSKIRKPGVQD
jgi:spermidine synthase